MNWVPEVGAADAVHDDVKVDPHAVVVASRRVDEELLRQLWPHVVPDLGGEEEDHDEGREEGDGSAAEGLDGKVLQSLGVGVQPLERREQGPEHDH